VTDLKLLRDDPGAVRRTQISHGTYTIESVDDAPQGTSVTPHRGRKECGRARGAGKGFRRPAGMVDGDLERSRHASSVVQPADRVASLPDNTHLRHDTGARAHVPLPDSRFRSGNGFSKSTQSTRSSPACNRPTRTATLIPHWSKPPSCFTAQPFSPKVSYPRTRQSSPDCSQTVWLAPCRTRDRSLFRRSLNQAFCSPSAPARRIRRRSGRSGRRNRTQRVCG
jgi:hypothetical protein